MIAFQKAQWMMEQLLRIVGPVPVRIVVEGAGTYCSPGVSPQFTLRIRDLKTLARLLIDPEIGFGEAYADGRVTVDGDLTRFLEFVYVSLGQGRGPGWYSRIASKGMELWQDNSPRGSRRNIQRHYDLGNDFYRLWLDRQMVYTCAYFPSPGMTLEDAQIAKMEYVCRKLRLEPGETVVEAGCGWGALALYMARHYGVRVKAFNISREQIQWARRRAADEDLGAVEFIEDDYRNIAGKSDVFVSVGMLEHVGETHYRDFSDVIHRVIGDNGRGLLHFIGRSYHAPFSSWIRKRIFPGAYAPALSEAAQILERHRYDILDVEDLRLHYARTCEHWLRRFENSRTQVSAKYGEWFTRAWQLYLAGSIAGFSTDTLQLFQIVFAGPKSHPPPWTRAHLDLAVELEPKQPWSLVTS